MTDNTSPAAWLRTKIERRVRLNVELDYCQPITLSIKEARTILAALTQSPTCCEAERERCVAAAKNEIDNWKNVDLRGSMKRQIERAIRGADQ